jgi:tetratricopeptide (TPR) repeat protein
MRVFYLAGLISVFFVHSLEAQKDRKLIREGVREYEKEKYGNAEISFRKALDKNQKSYPADYNVGNSLYKQNKFKEASEKFTDLSKKDYSKEQLSDVYHNLGNSYMQEKQYDKSVEAYKNSLRLRPDDEDTRYNLAYALSMLKQQQQQQQNQNKDKQDQDKKDDKNNDKQDEQKDQNKKEDQKQDKQQQQQQQKDQLTKQEAEQILEAIQNQEKKVQEKVEREKAKAAKVYTEKDW